MRSWSILKAMCIALKCLVASDTKGRRKAAWKGGYTEEVIRCNEDRNPLADGVKSFSVQILQSCKAKVDDVHMVLDAPLKPVHNSVDSGREAFLEDPHSKKLDFGRVLTNCCGYCGTVAEFVHPGWFNFSRVIQERNAATDLTNMRMGGVDAAVYYSDSDVFRHGSVEEM